MTSPQVATQLDIFGNICAPADLSPQQRIAWLLDNDPELRDNDRALMLAHWRAFDGLEQVLDEASLDAFEEWFLNVNAATHPETIRRRRAELQRLRTGDGVFQPSRGESLRRRALDGAGPPRR